LDARGVDFRDDFPPSMSMATAVRRYATELIFTGSCSAEQRHIDMSPQPKPQAD
jgi:hypothetical protein